MPQTPYGPQNSKYLRPGPLGLSIPGLVWLSPYSIKIVLFNINLIPDSHLDQKRQFTESLEYSLTYNK